MSEELKACPFCGSTRVFAWPSLVLCGKCGAKLAGNSREDSSAKWNRRVVTQEQVEAAAQAAHNEFWGDSPKDLYGVSEIAEKWEEVAASAFRAAGFEVK